MEKHTSSPKLYSLGVFLSLLCAVHCLVLPLILTLGSIVGLQFLSHPLVDVLIVPSACLIAGPMIYKDYKLHQQKTPLRLLLIAFPLILISMVFHFHALLSIGMLFMAVAQIINYRIPKKCCPAH